MKDKMSIEDHKQSGRILHRLNSQVVTALVDFQNFSSRKDSVSQRLRLFDKSVGKLRSKLDDIFCRDYRSEDFKGVYYGTTPTITNDGRWLYGLGPEDAKYYQEKQVEKGRQPKKRRKSGFEDREYHCIFKSLKAVLGALKDIEGLAILKLPAENQVISLVTDAKKNCIECITLILDRIY